MNKGRFMYIPSELLEELEDIKINCKVDTKADCLRIMAHNSKIAREIKINMNFMDNNLFNNKRKRK